MQFSNKQIINADFDFADSESNGQQQRHATRVIGMGTYRKQKQGGKPVLYCAVVPG